MGRRKKRRLKKQRAFKGKRKKLKTTAQYAADLRNNLPESEKWFWREWEAAGMKDPDDKCNEVFARFIPDVVNEKFKYVIEVDGSIHQKKEVKKRDEKKDKAFSSRGFEVFRVEAYDYEQFGMLVDMVEAHRDKFTSRPKVIRRSANNNCLV